LDRLKLDDEFETSGIKSGKLGEKSGKLEVESDKLENVSETSMIKSGKLEKESDKLDRDLLEFELPGYLVRDLSAIKRRAPQPEMRDLVVRLCAWRPLSSEEISRMLGRSRFYVTEAYLTPLVREGRLTLTMPERPTDPRQRYRALEPEE